MQTIGRIVGQGKRDSVYAQRFYIKDLNHMVFLLIGVDDRLFLNEGTNLINFTLNHASKGSLFVCEIEIDHNNFGQTYTLASIKSFATCSNVIEESNGIST